MRSVIEISIYEIIDMNESIKDKEFEGVSEKISEGKGLLI